MNRTHTLISFFVYSTQILIAYYFLIIQLQLEDILTIALYGSVFIGAGAFVDQLINPDENSKIGYIILLSVYYLLYKVFIFGFAALFILNLFDIEFQLHYIQESLPGVVIFISWTLGQKVGFFFQNRKLIEKATDGKTLTDIDKLKIFLYQVHRRSFLRMIIERNQAKFIDTSDLLPMNPAEFQKRTSLVSINMSNFLKFFKLRNLPQSKYVTFDQIVEIDFSKNKISNFSIYLFRIFPNVENINLSNNVIKNFTEEDQIGILDSTGHVIINFDGNPIFS